MDGSQLVAIILAAISLLGAGGLGKTMFDRWADRDRLRAAADGAARRVQFTDNEQARQWLRDQLDERDDELRKVRESEHALYKEVSDLRALVARQEERTTAQSARIDDLSATVARIGADYAKMEAERNSYREEKHEAVNKLTAEILARQLAERDKAVLAHEVERLRAQVESLARKESSS